MKIIALKSSNIKRLHAVEIRPTDAIVEITGENGAGKSSVLDSIWMALGGKETIPAEPIHTGEDKASIFLDLGELRVTRTFSRQPDATFTTSVKLERADGSSIPKPQTMLDTLYSTVAFDPLAFSRERPAQQCATLEAFITSVNLSSAATSRQTLFTTRTETNRSLKAAEARAAGIVLPAEPEKAKDVSVILSALEAAQNFNRDVARKSFRLSGLKDTRDRLSQEIAALQLKLDEAAREIGLVGAIAEEMPTDDLQNEADRAHALGISAERYRLKVEEKTGADQEVSRLSAISLDLTARIEAIDKLVDDGLASAKIPVPGLTLAMGADGVLAPYLGGVPFEQASQAEKLRASTALAAALNPKLKVALVRDGSLLDETSVALLGAMADQLGLQVWLETVESDRPGAIVIEDGRVAP